MTASYRSTSASVSEADVVLGTETGQHGGRAVGRGLMSSLESSKSSADVVRQDLMHYAAGTVLISRLRARWTHGCW